MTAERTVLATPRQVSFVVRGMPVPQGSVRAFVAGGRARVATRTPDLMAWRTAIATAASLAIGDDPVIGGPVEVRATFRLKRPASKPRKVVWPATRPDIDKLARALLDGITGVVISDDALVVRLIVTKMFATDQTPTGVYVDVERR